MAKGSVRKKGKKWYYRFYVEDASGNLVQKECAGTESKSETEKLLRQAMEDYESKKFIAKADNITLGQLLDTWAEEELKVGTLSNGTVENYLGAIRCIKKHPIADRRLKTVTAEHLQTFLDLLTFGGTYPDGTVKQGMRKDYIHSFSALLQHSFRFAVFPKQLITFNPSQYRHILYLLILPSSTILDIISAIFGSSSTKGKNNLPLFWLCTGRICSIAPPPQTPKQGAAYFDLFACCQQKC